MFRVLVVQSHSDSFVRALARTDARVECASTLPSSALEVDLCVVDGIAVEDSAALAPFVTAGVPVLLVVDELSDERLRELYQAGCTHVLRRPSDELLEAQVRSIARQCGRGGVPESRRSSRVFETPMMGMLLSGPDGQVHDANETLLNLLGYSREELKRGELNWKALTPPEWLSVSEEALGAVSAEGTAAPFEKEYVRKDGTRVPVLVASTRESRGQNLSVVLDIRNQIQTRERLALLSEASALLISSLDYRETLEGLAGILVPALSDWCAIDILGQDGEIQRLTVMHRDPEKRDLATRLRAERSMNIRGDTPVARVLRTGSPEWVPDVPDEMLQHAARDPEHLALIRSLGLKSYAVVPLSTGKQVLGCLSLVHAESNRVFYADDIAYLQELATRAALTLERAALYEAAERVKEHALLIAHIGEVLTRHDTLEVALRDCAHAIARDLGVSQVRVWAADPSRRLLRLRASVGPHGERDAQHRLVPFGLGSAGQTAVARVPTIRNRGEAPDTSWVDHPGIRAFASFPLHIRDKLIGVLAVYSERRLESDTLSTLHAAVDLIAVGMRRSQVEARVRAKRKALEVVNSVGRTLSAELNQDKLVQAITDSATKLAGADFGAFFYNVQDASGGKYLLYSLSGADRAAFERFPMPRATDVFRPTFDGEGVIRVDDIREDPRYGKNAPYHGMPEGHLPVVSYMAVPVRGRGGEVLGGLFFGHKEPGIFTKQAERLVSGVAVQAAIAMDNAALFTKAQNLIERLARSNRELDQFAYIVSHDLKAPLRGIGHLSEFIEEDMGPQITEEAAEHLRMLRERVKRLDQLIDGVLDYSRVGRTNSLPEMIKVGELVEDVVSLLASDVHPEVRIRDDFVLLSDRTQLQQIFMNLIGNAIKHANTAEPKVEVGVELGGAEPVFYVRDNGPGIPESMQDRIWGIFQTLPSGGTSGTGIGLAVVRKLVELRQGRAWVESDGGRGSTFRFTWPSAEVK
ncbi:MAG: GAF domain-containing protein [Polyangiaceae bacterium]